MEKPSVGGENEANRKRERNLTDVDIMISFKSHLDLIFRLPATKADSYHICPYVTISSEAKYDPSISSRATCAYPNQRK